MKTKLLLIAILASRCGGPPPATPVAFRPKLVGTLPLSLAKANDRFGDWRIRNEQPSTEGHHFLTWVHLEHGFVSIELNRQGVPIRLFASKNPTTTEEEVIEATQLTLVDLVTSLLDKDFDLKRELTEWIQSRPQRPAIRDIRGIHCLTEAGSKAVTLDLYSSESLNRRI
jgi:hypothetical protein